MVCKQDAKTPKILSLLPSCLALLWNLIIGLPLTSLSY